jgi:GNAT superfamily N-acetyltransferase
MSEAIQITLETESNREDARAIGRGLDDFNHSMAGDEHYLPLHLIVRDTTGTVVGGLLADTYWGWMAVNILGLRDDLRGQGLGARLLRMAEEEAVRRGCKNAHLDTFNFQALDFYRKYGYTVFGQLDGLPPGHTRYYLRKTLA